jgi:hypothetical protein
MVKANQISGCGKAYSTRKTMDQINTIELIDPSVYPDNKTLQGILGQSYEVYLETLLQYQQKGLNPEWRYYKDGKAWLCKVCKGKKTIIWMSAWKNYIKATIYIPGVHVSKLLEIDLCNTYKQHIINAENVGKSKPCMFELRDKSILEDFFKVVQFKIDLK